jgi:hypothetical protein
MKMKRWLLAGGMAAAMAAAVAAGPARAANPVPINRFTDWLAQTYDDSGKTLCYATSAPKKQAGNFKSRGNPYIAITHAPQSGVRDQVSYIAGYDSSRTARSSSPSAIRTSRFRCCRRTGPGPRTPPSTRP